MEKYSSAVSEMYSQFKKVEVHPMEKYVGKLARCGGGEISEVVGYSTGFDGSYILIVDGSKTRGWDALGPDDIIFKECEDYQYASISDLID